MSYLIKEDFLIYADFFGGVFLASRMLITTVGLAHITAATSLLLRRMGQLYMPF